MEFGIFDFYKVFSRAFGEGEDRDLNGSWGHPPAPRSLPSNNMYLYH